MATTDLLQRTSGFVTDGGLETDLIHHHGVELPQFAAFPLLDDTEGRRLLRQYYDGYARVAAETGCGLVLEAPTWRANPDWGARLGYGADDLDRINTDAIGFLREIAETWRDDVAVIVLAGMVGPRGDGYLTSTIGPEAAEDYHLPQVRALARAGVDLVAAYTLSSVGEAVGIARAGRRAGVAVSIAFTVETDGRLADGTTLAAAIEAVDADCPPLHYGLNCAHPRHIAPGLATPGNWRERIRVLRVNASSLSHAELDESDHLHDGVPADLAVEVAQVRLLLPGVRVVGGCCGTDVRHVAAMWGV